MVFHFGALKRVPRGAITQRNSCISVCHKRGGATVSCAFTQMVNVMQQELD